MTIQNELEVITRAPAGGIVGLNGLSYAGGEFLPLSARGGNRGQAARDEIAKREAKDADAMAKVIAWGKQRVAKELSRRAALKDLIPLILREVDHELRRDGFWHNTAAHLRITFREWREWDGVTHHTMECGWMTGTLLPKWANRIARTDEEYEALTSDV